MKRFVGMFFVLIIAFVAVGGVAGVTSQKAQAQQNYFVSEEASVEVVDEIIEYNYKSEDAYYNPYKLPIYSSPYGCGVTSGSLVVASFNRVYNQLIPGHTAGYTFLGQWVWTGNNTYIQNMQSDLNTAMNVVNGGVTISGYLGGLNTYVSGKGYTFTSEKTMGNGNNVLDNKYKQALKDGKLLAIFTDGFNLISFGQYGCPEGYDDIKINVYTGAHILTAYGYYEVSYRDANNIVFRKDTYLYVNSGYSTLCLMRINSLCTVDDCYILNVS